MTRANVSASCIARPPDTTIRAPARSGRSLAATSARTKRDRSLAVPDGVSTITALPPDVAASSNAMVRTVTTSFASRLSTVAIALPA